ncbi:MAG: LysR substrate-binding domain-containing protein [Hyphomicrobium sp.]|jgi:LysR family cys regulon transcriptional activator
MNLQQLRILRETIRCNFNVTEVANSIYASQSGVSKQIRDLEMELGALLFLRRGKRLLGLTELGEEVVRIADRLLLEADNIRQAASRFAVSDRGTIQVATTHTQARYALPDVILQFRKLYPDVRLVLQQMGPRAIPSALLSGEADVAIATDVLVNEDEILAFPFYCWKHILIVPAGHALAERNVVSLEEIADHPIVTYDAGVTGRSRIDKAFEAIGIVPDIAMTALDADVIKTYVELGLGIGIIAPMAFDARRDVDLRVVKLKEELAESTTSLAVRRGRLLRGFVYRFIELCAPKITEDIIREADEKASEYESRERIERHELVE